ncbi:rhodanese-like domain-containing protein [Brevibacillus agri]|uniref:rhodanese-like domain-containing protein n=1 Tax=Brevibacillus TaxID=55080 RepID=UPI00203E869E|nr:MULTISPECIES: rhodanese-like domain-containing protein [Brevibacillus]MCM3431709.1 rhodanese-like domain-containing protein [Brevibacillus invocatus]MED1645885.1 rhodanese-like domain-containing protein [Brevibacillus agri]MED1657582.1 rhodanese-like domain-containing protein [Brevibacillus agri]MED1690074.1 rhodanese-like domain-containing protein [Brevibacillus agri]MED1694009.1 rhodanese-like domain-containing protein [Brevibacillus agri]
MRKIWVVSMLVLLIAAGVYWMNISENSAVESSSSLQIVGSEALTQMINDQTDMTIVDLREPELFAQGSVPNAINIPFAEIRTKYTSIPKDKKVVFVCHTGRMGTESGNFLLENGYRDVYNLDGGMAKWKGKIEQ